MLAFPGVLAKGDVGLTGFSPAVMVVSIFWNWYSVMVPYFLVPLEYAIG